MSSKSVIVIGGGLAGLSSAVALADAGFRVRLLEQQPFLGGRASSYALPGGEHVDNCQHVTLGCCTNLDDFYRRVGAAGKIVFYDRLVFVDRAGPPQRSWRRRSLPAPLHLAPSLAFYPSLTWAERHAIGHAMLAIARRGGHNAGGDAAGKSMLEWLRQHGQSRSGHLRASGASCWSARSTRNSIASTRATASTFSGRHFIANRSGYRVGIPSVPLSDLYDGCRTAIERQGGEVRVSRPRPPLAHLRWPSRRRRTGWRPRRDRRCLSSRRAARSGARSCCRQRLVEREPAVCGICAI